MTKRSILSAFLLALLATNLPAAEQNQTDTHKTEKYDVAAFNWPSCHFDKR